MTKLATLGAKAIIEALENFDNLSSTKQNEEGVTYAKKLKKDEAWIDWRQSADKINRQIRAFNPYPIAQSNATSDKFESKVLRILSANIVEKTSHEKTRGSHSTLYQRRLLHRNR
ncbi:Methionyl-tRNA formyltransferase (EC [uncultured Gammaproteobacteria bacterium]|nr:Methionyl-tRNA formyltransferase (EC [uncultured Gammaproteobacteria bacterium]